MADWRRVTVAEVASEVTVGHVGTMADQYVEEGVPFLRSLNVEPFDIKLGSVKYIAENFHQQLKKSSLSPGDVVVVRTGKPGACAVIPTTLPKANCSDLVIIRCNERIRPRYLCYIINSVALFHIDSHLVGAVQQHFNVSSARTISFDLPPLAIQDSTLALLGSLDDKIDLNRRMNETLEAMARAIFKDWFVDFGPTRAKMEGRAPYLAQEIWELFPDALDDEGKPTGWGIITLGDVLTELETGTRPKGGVKDIVSGVPSIGAESIVKVGHFDFGKTKFISQDFFNRMSRGILQEKDVLIYKDGGKPGELRPAVSFYSSRFPFTRCCINEHVFRARINNELGQEFLYLWLSSAEGFDQMRNKATGVAQPGLNQPAMRSILGITANSKELHSFFSILIEPLLESCNKNALSSKTLAQTRDLLLPKLMSGEIRVKDAEKAVGAVL